MTEAVTNSMAVLGGAKWRTGAALLLFVVAVWLFAALQYGNLSHPLLWQDEAETAMFAERILDYGYPKVHDDDNGDDGSIVYGMAIPLEQAVHPIHDAYLGSLWGQYYFAVAGAHWARHVDDPFARTLRLRIPFTIAGSVGLLLFLFAIWPLVGQSLATRLTGAALFVLSSALSISLLLHLREIRYYALVILFVGALVAVQTRLPDGKRRHSLSSKVTTTALLFLLFNTFYPAAVAVATWIVLESGITGSGSFSQRVKRSVANSAPVGITFLLCIPIALYFRMAEISAAQSSALSLSPSLYLEHLRLLVAFLFRYELLLAVVGCRVLGWLALRFEGPASKNNDLAARGRETAHSLIRLVIVYSLIGALNPAFFERYFTVLSPLLLCVVLLDCAAVWARISRASSSLPRRQIFALGMIVLALVTVWIRLPEIQGRLQEVDEAYRGPIDQVVEYIRENYEEPGKLTIATNYEAESLMYYLGARVVGRFHSSDPEAIASERAADVDIVVIRKRHRKRLRQVRRYLDDGEYELRLLPAVDLPYNNIPELYKGRLLNVVHLWQTQEPVRRRDKLAVYERTDE